MGAAGALRAKLSSTLTSAYARGLLSEDTFALRLDAVLGDRVIDPEELVGDLYLRGPDSRLRSRLSHTMSTAIGRVETFFADAHEVAPTLLALDWTGAQGDVVVGRSSRCDVVLSDPTISREHARLRFRDGRWVLQDLGSTNGTAVNGRPVGRCELRPGDTLLLGYFSVCVD